MPSSRQNKRLRLLVRLLCAIAWVLLGVGVFWLRSPSPSAVFDAPVRHFYLDNVSRSDAVKALSGQTDTRLDVDWNAMTKLALLPDTPISLHIESATLGQTLKAIFAAPGYKLDDVLFETDRGTIHVTSEFEQSRVTCVYDIGDIVEASYAQHLQEPRVNESESGGGFTGSRPTRQECAEEFTRRLANVIATPPDWMNVSERYLIITHGREKQKQFAALIAEFHRANGRKPGM